jgi:ABC-type Zn uptake system ZnuABC Zn-binding protein ZnuA
MSIAIFFVNGCNTSINKVGEEPVAHSQEEKEVSLNIVTTDKVLYYMVKDIVKDRHHVDYMFAYEDRISSFKYSEDSINNISKKDLFFYWGSGVEPWINGFVDKLSKSKVGPINSSRGVKVVNYEKEAENNPYFWMNVDYYKIAMLNIKNAIQDKDTKVRDQYEQNFSNTIKEIDSYNKKYKELADKLKDYTFIVDGDELDYFTKYYGFRTLKLYNYGLVLTPEDIKKNNTVEDKIKESKNVVFLYDKDEEIKANEALISKYSLKTINILLYKNDIKYMDILDLNLSELDYLVEQE